MNKPSLALKSFFAVAVMALSVGAHAGEKEDAVRFVSAAAAQASANKAEALAEIAKPDGKYVKGSVYVFAYDTNAVMLAHPVNAKLVGKNLMEVPDAAGKLFRKEIIEGVKQSPNVTVDYKYKNPKTSQIEDKVTYCEKAADIVLCAGYYK